MVYDAKEAKVHVKVEQNQDDNNKAKATVTYDGKNDIPTFTNKYQPAGTSVALTAKKTYVKSDSTPAALKGGEFTFNLYEGDLTAEQLKDKQPIQTAENGEDGTVTFENLVFGVTYVWKEVQAPKGYLLNKENTGIWSVEEHDAEIQYTAKDNRRPGSISVTKQNTDGQPLFGATFLLEYKDGDTWKPVYHSETLAKGGTTSNVTDGKLTTDESGTITFEKLWADEEIQYRLTETQAPEGYELLKEPVFEGTLPVSYPDGKVTATPDEVIDGTAYFYNLPVTVQNGYIYTLPMTGGSSFPFVPLAIIMILFGYTAT